MSMLRISFYASRRFLRTILDLDLHGTNALNFMTKLGKDWYVSKLLKS